MPNELEYKRLPEARCREGFWICRRRRPRRLDRRRGACENREGAMSGSLAQSVIWRSLAI
jgi:hypothetical protein